MFREFSGNPNPLEESIDGHRDDLGVDALGEHVREQLQPYYLERLAGMVDRFHAAGHREQATDDLTESATVAIADCIDTLRLEAERRCSVA